MNAVVLLGLTALIVVPTLTGAPARQRAAGPAKPSTGAAAPANGRATAGPPVRVPTKKEVLADDRLRFGLSAPEVPWSPSEVGRLSTVAGASPTMLQFFVKWDEDLRPDAIAMAYQQRAVPIVSWEPWEGSGDVIDQPKYALRRIADGAHDAYVTRFATAVRDVRYPVAIRFAHEMNGVWYPWSERRSGNQRGEYVQAWRHVHDVFTRLGVTNVIWIWSPNILRPVPNVSLEALYPGDRYVDLVGMVGYAVRERTAEAVFGPTLKSLARFTDKRVVITETGVQPGPLKTGWIRDFFRWLPRQRRLAGFVWFEYSATEGGKQDWRFSADPNDSKAFKAGLKKLRLAAPPR